MDQYIDLHLHTTFSDGLATPERLLKKVLKSRLAAFAVTDHDSIDGLKETARLLPESGPELVSGMELSSEYDEVDLHILGYMFDVDNDLLNKTLKDLQKKRDNRAQKIVEKLKELGMDIPYSDVLEAADGGSVGRPHIADILHKHGYTKSYLEAFRKYIATRGPAYVPKARISPVDAIKLIHQAGGLAVLAHPMVDNAVQHVEILAEMGLDGLEVYHYSASRQDRQRIKRLAEKLGLVLTGGSDYHGRDNRRDIIARSRVPYEFLEGMKKRHQELRGTN